MPDHTQFRLNQLAASIALALSFAYVSNVHANDLCSGSVVKTCEGNQSSGIEFTSGVQQLDVSNLSEPIHPASGTAGIRLRSDSGLDLTVNSGTPQANVSIVTGQAPGITTFSQGTPPSPPNDPLLNVPIPGAVGVSGGVVQVDSYSDITTSGTNAHGIAAQSSTSGYPDSVITALENFSDAGISFTVTSVKNPDGTEGGLDTPVSARIALVTEGADGLEIFDGYAGEAGSFTLSQDGTVSFNPGTDFGGLAVGESRIVSVNFVLDGYRDGILRRSNVQGELIAEVTMTNSGLEIVKSAYFEDFGDSGKPETEQKAVPDLDSYVASLLDQTNGAGGSGNSVTVRNLAGEIKTTGAASHGVFAQSNGKGGGSGRNGGGFFSFGTKKPSEGGAGNPGGNVALFVDGTVSTTYQPEFIPINPLIPFNPADPLDQYIRQIVQMNSASVGVFAHSAGGNGGRGGNGGTYYYGRRGGTGGDGGLVEVFGNGVVETDGHYTSGILAVSEGGDGGDGGDGADVTGGGAGGFGGKGGTVHVEGTWNVTTHGNSAHGIWAKSLGGNAGTGGSGGWLAGSPAPGGQATDGGSVTLISGGTITTWGSDSYGLFAQSVGGFGGSGGSGGSIFYSRGGNGNSAGSGGAVSLTNLSSGHVVTHGIGAHAVYAQSIGGGGGAGGGGGGIVGVGGSGAAGGLGGTVEVSNAGLIQTYGEGARGIYAQSIGGGGGDGGDSAGLVAVGGGGSGTSDGGNVTVTNSGVIETANIGGNAIFAQSIGGGGGSGGSSTGWFSVGGSGGGGGDAGKVAVTNSGERLETAKADATAVFAQSVGGGGGKGGNSTAVGAFVSMAIGGKGAAGGKGDEVRVDSLAGDILTSGNRSHGIFAQSIGGGGGDGGYAVSASVGIGGSVSIGVGGAAGGGGDSAKVDVVNHSHIKTGGNDADGIFAESVGGGGGTGGFAISGAASDGLAISFALGGKGGSGGDGKAVDLRNYGLVETSGDRSVGLQAQSVGGGGGNGGFSIAASGAGVGALSFDIGGFGGDGGDSDTVRIENDGRIETHGREAYGLLAQSLGGGGGNGGFAISAAGAGTGAASLGIGGGGAGGGDSKAVTVISRGAIDTWGDSAIGLFAQSVGGGGGNGGFVITAAGAGTGAGTLSVGGSGGLGGNADQVTVNSFGNIHTRGADAYGLVAQSIGGGGGNGGFSITGSGAGTGAGSVGIGGFGAKGGDGKRVDVTNDGAIDTEGERAVGLFAQSVGGGGGSGGFSISGSGAGTGAGTLNLGGFGDGGGNADIVTAGNTGRLVTQGKYAYGLLAQSVGGGGGNGGFSITGSGAGTGAGSLGVGGFAGDGGDGKAVTVTNSGNVYTYGEGAAGLFSQSVGGGGGTGGFSIAGSGAKAGSGTFSLGGGGGGGGSASSVNLTNSGSVTTYGVQAYGAIAQSVGGGGGSGGFSFSGGVTTDGFTLNASVGGFGGTGGDGGYVSLVNHGVVTTVSNDAHALVAQSIGGGGGSGGFSGSLSASAGSKPNVSISIGGFGGAAGDAAEAHLENDGALFTEGIAAYGLFAQSIGGGGGDGGGSLALALGKHDGAANVAASYGGSGNAGGNGGLVDVFNAGTVTTTGAKAHGLVAQSVGGGGGNGGFSITGVLAKGTNTKDLSVSVGGFGGAGGDAGRVVVSNEGGIHAQGSNASGIVAQSLGGGGGNGGFSFAGSFAGTQAKDLGLTVGGFGGAGGKGQDVTVHNTGVIETGTAPADEAALPSTAMLSLLALDESDLPPLPNPPPPPPLPEEPEALLIERYATYTAYGIFAQSVGGGGGDGGASISVGAGFGGAKDTWNVNSAIGVGGSGGSGNIGGYVGVTNENAVTTRENDSHAIFAQSVGGGGGKGGDSFTATIGFGAANEGRSFNGNLAVGGTGGSGNLGREVHVDNTGALTTYGDMSDGIRAQSIGGGGGSGGSARSMNFLFKAGSAKLEKDQTAGTNWKTQIVVGGNGGDGNNGGTVHVVNSGEIVTEGALSRGIFAQSIGGGGGSGGDGILGTGTAADDYLLLATLLEDPGGGGNFITKFLKGQLRNLSVAVGGNEGSKGDANAVTVENTGNITTHGYGATAILAQSVGGGGGEAQSFASGEDAGGKAVAGAFGKIAIGGAGGSGGNGGEVHVDNNAIINTYGDAAHGIFAQSVGGGGGIAGNVERALSRSLDIGLGLDFGRSGGGAGDGGTVTVSSSGSITTRGADAYGIFAQSVGGGGGVASSLSTLGDLITPLLGLAGSVGGDGSGGLVDITHTGNITTTGYASHGIFAQSAGGKHSEDDTTDYLGVGGKVTVVLDGNIDVQDADADGIFAQSVGMDGAGDIHITIAGGSVQGGSASAAGVHFLDGAANLLTNHGAISALSGMAILGGAGNETIDNFGIVTGNVDLGAGVNAFNNQVGGQFNSSEFVILGTGNLLTNAGTLSPGGAGAFQTTTITGDMAQAESGTYATEISADGEHDQLDVSGTAALKGEILVMKSGTGRYLDGTRYEVLKTASGITGAFDTQSLPAPTPLLTFSVAQQALTIDVVAAVQPFTTAAKNRVERATAEYLDTLAPGADGDLGNVMGEIQSLSDPKSLSVALTSLGPDTFDGLTRAASAGIGAQTAQLLTRLGALRASDQLPGRGASSFAPLRLAYSGELQSLSGLFAGEKNQRGKHGLWLEAFGHWGDQENDGDGYTGFESKTAGITLAYDRRLGENWIAGAALSYSHADVDFNASRTNGNISGRYLSLYGSWQKNGAYADGVLSYGRNSYDQRRWVNVGSIESLAMSEHDGDVFAASLSGGFMAQAGDWRRGPYAALRYARIDEDSFRETGAGVVDLLVGSKTTDALNTEVGLRALHSVPWRNGDLVTELNAGWRHDFGIDDRVISACFAGAPGTSFALQGQDVKHDGAIFGAGLSYAEQKGVTAALRYQGEFQQGYEAHAVFGELRIDF